MWWIYGMLSALFASLTAIFSKLGIVGVNTNLAMGIRTIVILMMTWSIILLKNDTKQLTTFTKQHLFFLIISGITTGLSWLFYFKALQLGPVSQVATIDKLSVALTIVLAIIFLGETLTLKTAIGAALIIAGTLVLIKK